MKDTKFLRNKFSASLFLSLITVLAVCSQSAVAVTAFGQTNLVTDDNSINPAAITDSDLVNGWGISFSATGPFWLSDNGTGKSTVYSVDHNNNPAKVPLTVSIPGAGNVTGQVFNTNAANTFNHDVFVFASEDGTISGWRGALGATAETLVAGNSTNIYKGVAEATLTTAPGVSNSFLYAANFGTGAIDVIDGTSLTKTSLAGNFIDPNLPANYAPFNIQNLNNELIVTYAEKATPTAGDEVAGAGKGFVSIFDLNGNFIERLASNGALDAPWGVAIAPSSFGEFAGNLLVGNFGDGKISAYNLSTHSFTGQLSDSNGQAIAIDGLWGIAVGNGGSAGNTQNLYFAAGPGGEAHGLFGVVAPVPLPGAVWLFTSALLGLGYSAKRKAQA